MPNRRKLNGKRQPRPENVPGGAASGLHDEAESGMMEKAEEPHEKDVPNRIPSEVRKMKLLFRQRAFSWFDSYDIYDENENTVYVVKGQLSWGHCLKIYDPEEQQELGTVKEEILTWLPKFELYEGETCIGTLKKELTFFKPKYNIDFNGWHVEGDVFEWDYTITGPDGGTVAAVSKEPFHWTDTYVLDITDPQDALYVLMFVLAIDAEKCSRN